MRRRIPCLRVIELHWLWIAFVVLGACLGAVPLAAQDDGLPRPDFGPSFIERLRDAKTRHKATTELYIATFQAEPDEVPFAPFYIRDSRLTRCPSPQGSLWMASFDTDWLAMDRMKNPQEHTYIFEPEAYPLLPDDPGSHQPPTKENPYPVAATQGEHNGLWSPPPAAMEGRFMVFLTDSGKVVWPFEDTITDHGWIFDLNGDSVLDRADTEKWMHPTDPDASMEIESFSITTLEPQPRRLLHVLYNWHDFKGGSKNRWEWEMRDVDGDGHLEACVGPEAGSVIEAKAVYRWNHATQSYEGPPGGADQHFLRQPDLLIDDYDWIETVARLGGMSYAQRQTPPQGSPGTAKVEAQARLPVEPVALSSMTDSQIAAFFLSGRADQGDSNSFSPQCDIPRAVWTLPPREAALRLAEANRSAEHRDHFALVTAPDAGPVPQSGSVQTNMKGGWGGDSTEWLCVEEKRCFLLSLPFNRNPGVGLEARTIPLDRARWILQTVWWLDQVRTKQRRPFEIEKEQIVGGDDIPIYSMSLSPEKGCRLVVHPSGMLAPLGPGWRGHYARRIALKLSAGLWHSWLEREMGSHYKFAPIASLLRDSLAATGPASPLFPAQWVGALAMEAGYAGHVDGKAPLEKLVAGLPPEGELARQWVLNQSLPTEQVPAVHWGEASSAETKLRESLQSSLMMITAFRDKAGLERICDDDTKDYMLRQWASQRLNALADKLYDGVARPSPSEPQLPRPEEKLKSLIEQCRWDEAATFVAGHPVGERPGLMAQLCHAWPEDRAWPPGAFEDLLTAVLDGRELRIDERLQERAFDLLVPAQGPSRFEDALVDRAIGSVLRSPDPVFMDRILANASLALVRRHPDVSSFEVLLPLLRNDFGIDRELNAQEEALAHLVNLDDGVPRQLLEKKMTDRFTNTKGRWPGTSLLAWTADLRGLESDLHQAATHDEEDIEPSIAHSLYQFMPIGRHHAARWVVALWREPPSLARAKALVCLTANAGWISDAPGLRGPRWRLEKEFRASLTKLDAGQRASLADFITALPNFDLPRLAVTWADLTRACEWAQAQLKEQPKQ